jgi:hypothetical protein
MSSERGESPAKEKTIEGLVFSVGFVDNGFMLNIIHDGVLYHIPLPKSGTGPDLAEIEETTIRSRVLVRITESGGRKKPNTKYELTILDGDYKEQEYRWDFPC